MRVPSPSLPPVQPPSPSAGRSDLHAGFDAVVVAAVILAARVLSSRGSVDVAIAPALACLLLLPAAARGERFARGVGFAIFALAAFFFFAFGPSWRDPGVPLHAPLGLAQWPFALWPAPFALAFAARARARGAGSITRSLDAVCAAGVVALMLATGLALAGAALAPLAWSSWCSHTLLALAVVAAARVAFAVVSLSSDEARGAPGLVEGALACAAAVAPYVVSSLVESAAPYATSAKLVVIVWALGASTALSAAVPIAVARRAGLGALGVLVAAAVGACATCVLVRGGLLRVFADYGAVPGPVAWAFDLGDFGMRIFGDGILAAAPSLPLALLAVASLRRRAPVAAAAALAVFAGSILVCAVVGPRADVACTLFCLGVGLFVLAGDDPFAFLRTILPSGTTRARGRSWQA